MSFGPPGPSCIVSFMALSKSRRLRALVQQHHHSNNTNNPSNTHQRFLSSQRWWDAVRMPEDVHVIDVVERLWYTETAPLTSQLQAKAV